MSELKTLSNGQIVPLLGSADVGDAGDVLTRVGADGAAFQAPAGGGGAWGDITGTLADQTDLQSALDAKAAASTAILHQATVELNNSQIKALPTTGVQIVAAPGANKLIVPTAAVLKTNSVWIADYTNIAATAVIALTVGTTSALLSLDEAVGSSVTALLAGGGPDGTLAITSPRFRGAGAYGPVTFVGVSNAYDSDLLNLAFSISATNTGDFTGGNAANTLRVSVTYYILNTLTGVYE